MNGRAMMVLVPLLLAVASSAVVGRRLHRRTLRREVLPRLLDVASLGRQAEMAVTGD
jgi:hypothetical protein